MASSDRPCSAERLLADLGQIDIYVFDQLLRGRIGPEMRVLDAGCGEGRNCVYLMRCGADVYGIDSDPGQIDRIRELAAEVAPSLPADNFQVGHLATLPFPDESFEAVICSAVLHFAEDPADFEGMMDEMWRVLTTEGVFFSRLASTIGLEDRVRHLRNRWYHLPDGSDRFLVDESYLSRVTSNLGAELLDPLKTTIVQGQRSMTTWVLRKGGREAVGGVS